ncbi:MAG: dephospho-CoA kinase [Alphaproteobacteria bacterium]|nr:dephospho-CoA kinase [Alphaproteobacteria bacterium]
MKIIGITGAIGCGKTTLSTIFKNMGYEVFDADQSVALIYKNENFLLQLKSIFPRVFKNNAVDKRLLREIVFSNQKELLKLEDLVEPFLQKLFIDKINEMSKKQGILFIDAVLLFEKGWNRFCEKVICVTVDPNIQKQRVMKRDNITEDDFYKIYHLQMNNGIKCQISDIVVDTDCSLEVLENKARKILKELK